MHSLISVISFTNTKGKTFAAEAGDTVRRGGRGIGHAIGVLFKVFFLFIAGTIAFGLFVGLMALMFGGIAWWPINNFLWTSKWQQLFAWGTLIFFLIVPLVGFIIWLVRRIIGVRRRTSYLGWIFGVLWTFGWVCAILFATSMFRDWSEYEKTDDHPVSIVQPTTGKMLVVVTKPELEYTGRFGWMNDGGDGWDLSEDSLKLSMVDIDIDKSVDSEYHVYVRKFAFGKNRQEAIKRAGEFNYAVSSKDSLLDLDNGYTIYKNSKFRGQRAQVVIQVPVGKKIQFDESVRRKLNPAEVKYRSHRGYKNVDIIINADVSFWWETGTEYIMQADGQLRDINGRTPEQRWEQHSEEYRYDQEPIDSVVREMKKQQQLKDREQNLKERERELEEEKRKLEEDKKQPSGQVTKHQESMDDEIEPSFTSSTSPVFSMVKTFF